jgi:hypothetical protein
VVDRVRAVVWHVVTYDGVARKAEGRGQFVGASAREQWTVEREATGRALAVHADPIRKLRGDGRAT